MRNVLGAAVGGNTVKVGGTDVGSGVAVGLAVFVGSTVDEAISDGAVCGVVDCEVMVGASVGVAAPVLVDEVAGASVGINGVKVGLGVLVASKRAVGVGVGNEQAPAVAKKATNRVNIKRRPANLR
ncbi:MAG: hypothetical protein H5T69_01890 [Chloroflexi bacterium]|nr:hypothetical protein [Chloroflexota bacterium]